MTVMKKLEYNTAENTNLKTSNETQLKNLRIAILTPTFSYFSGPDRVVERQAGDLSTAGHQVTIFTLEGDIVPPLGVRVVKMGVPKAVAMQRMYRLLFFLDVLKVWRYVTMLASFDKIICHMYPMTILARKAQRKYKIHYNYYNMGIAYPTLFETHLERLYMRFFLFLTTLTVRGADSATSISDFLRRELKNETGVDGDVEYCMISPRYNLKVSGSRIRSKYNLDFPTLLYVGRLSPHKGIHLLIEAFRVVQKSYPKAYLLIVGKPTFEGYFLRLKKLARGDPHIIFVGFVDDNEISEFYGACDVYTSCTQWEGFNLPAAEAQACGKKVVLFNVGSHPEVVEVGKGVLVEKVSPYDFGSAVVSVLRPEKNKMNIKSNKELTFRKKVVFGKKEEFRKKALSTKYESIKKSGVHTQ